MNDTPGASDVPYYLMPVAAVCGMYAFFLTLQALGQIYQVATFYSKNTPTKIPPSSLKSKQFLRLVASIIGCVLAYGYICAKVNNALVVSEIFDPYEILNIHISANSTVVKSAYRQLSKQYHPDKGGDAYTFQKINLAYKALTDDVARDNYERFGHPDGPQTVTLDFALPDWLLHPEGNVAVTLALLYLAIFVAMIIYLVRWGNKAEEDAKKVALDNSVAQSDMIYLAKHLRPDSTHHDVLFYIATSPENINITQQSLNSAEDLKKARMEYLNPKNKVEAVVENFDMDGGGWADDDDEDEASKVHKAKQEEKERLAKEVAAASGQENLVKLIKIEGIDDGVLGQNWVERTLTALGQWPPSFEGSKLANMKFMDKSGKSVSALDHPAVRRNLCMTLGRLNSQKLNTHPELIEAGKDQNIDVTYFRSTMEYRQRTGLLLEAALRVAGSLRSYRLYKTIVECVAMFKIGTTTVSDDDVVSWFKKTMESTYGGHEGIPSIKIDSIKIETPGENEIANDDTCSLELNVDRLHAENFTKQKIEAAAKQGIPPQIALQTYREGWWVLIRSEKLDGEDIVNDDNFQTSPILSELDQDIKSIFLSEKGQNRLLNAWPFIVSNVAQKSGKLKVQFKAPSTPGKFKFYIDVKSQEFLGCDQTFVIQKDILDKETLEREEKEEQNSNENDDPKIEKFEEQYEEESKKNK